MYYIIAYSGDHKNIAITEKGYEEAKELATVFMREGFYDKVEIVEGTVIAKLERTVKLTEFNNNES